MSFPPSLPPNNPLFPPGFPPPNVPQLPRFPIPMAGLARPLVPLPMGVTVPAGVTSISAPPVRKQNTAVIAAPPVIAVNPQPTMLYAQTNPLLPKVQTAPAAVLSLPDSNKKLAITTVFVGNITDRASDMLIRQLLSKCGSVHNWKRIQGPDGKLQAFGFCDYADPESAMRAIRLLHEFTISDKKLIVKADAKTQEKLDEYNKNIKSGDGDKNDLDEEDKIIKGQLLYVLREHEIELSKEPDNKEKKNRHNKDKDPKLENLSDMDIEDDKRNLIHREIDKFRDTYKKYDEEKEEEKRKKEEERTRRSDRRGDSKKRSRSRDRDGDSRSRRKGGSSKDDRDRRNRDRRSSSYELETLERDRSQSPVDEEESLIRRRRQEQNREKEISYQRRLRDWESREKRKAREYERERQKELRRKKEEEIEKQKLKQFLQDYDDSKHDEKYYSGKALLQRQMERRKEIEQDEYERSQERKELEELRKKLNQEGHPDPESEVRKRFHVGDSSNELDRLNSLMDEVRSKNLFTGDDDSQGSASNAVGGQSVKTFGFAGMKISTGQNLDVATNGGTTHSDAAIVNSDRMTLISAQQNNKHQQGSSSSSHISKSMIDAAKRKKITVSDVFNSNDDDDINSLARKRRPPPNTLFEDSNTDSNLSTTSNTRQQMSATVNSSSQMTQEEKKIQIKNLIDKIPTSKSELFSYVLDWDLLDNNLMERRIRPWISKKIRDYIGEEETTFLDFICQKLLAKAEAQSLLDDVAMVLDDEAQVFVVKLWRLLIYEIEAKKLGLNKY
uniref:RNA-binding protein 25-like n=1 Tax=Dermatophagoides pteronyssinus TaxID=6956 RepID=A0A6P6Y4S8_DERPT|nr:RNA-binding protein 25-like [Dermatophagoides pteronyssinus]